MLSNGTPVAHTATQSVKPPTLTPLTGIFVGYADSFLPRGIANPLPWKGSPGVTFVGCAPQLTDAGPAVPDMCPQDAFGDEYDTGAIRIDNGTTAPMVVSNGSVSIGNCGLSATPALYTPWLGLSRTTPVGGTLILTQTGIGGDPCLQNLGGNYNFDTSESSGNGNCTPNGAVPVIHLTINGVPTTITDNGQILNTGGIDFGACTGGNETQDWVQVQ